MKAKIIIALVLQISMLKKIYVISVEVLVSFPQFRAISSSSKYPIHALDVDVRRI